MRRKRAATDFAEIHCQLSRTPVPSSSALTSHHLLFTMSEIRKRTFTAKGKEESKAKKTEEDGLKGAASSDAEGSGAESTNKATSSSKSTAVQSRGQKQEAQGKVAESSSGHSSGDEAEAYSDSDEEVEQHEDYQEEEAEEEEEGQEEAEAEQAPRRSAASTGSDDEDGIEEDDEEEDSSAGGYQRPRRSIEFLRMETSKDMGQPSSKSGLPSAATAAAQRKAEEAEDCIILAAACLGFLLFMALAAVAPSILAVEQQYIMAGGMVGMLFYIVVLNFCTCCRCGKRKGSEALSPVEQITPQMVFIFSGCLGTMIGGVLGNAVKFMVFHK